MLWGATGVGKSESIRQLAAELNAELRDIRLCQKQPTDIGGLPALDHETKQTVFYPPAFLAAREDKKAVVLFFDEISLAPDDTRSAVLGILEERRQGNVEIPGNWISVAAGNRPEDLGCARGLGAAANRRLLHIVIEPRLEATLAHFMKISIAPEVLAFLKVFPQHLSGEESARLQKHELFPRPASWEKVSNVLGELKKADKRTKHLAVAGIIGDSVAAEFMLLAEEVKNMKSVDELLEIQQTTPSKIGRYLPDTIAFCAEASRNFLKGSPASHRAWKRSGSRFFAQSFKRLFRKRRGIIIRAHRGDGSRSKEITKFNPA